jgi:hypothetical protein
VLLIRERALLLDEQTSVNRDDCDSLAELKDDFEFSDTTSSHQDGSKRSRSMTPNRVSLVRLIRRINRKWRALQKGADKEIKEEDDDESMPGGDSQRDLDAKQMHAQARRELLEGVKSEFVKKDLRRRQDVLEKAKEKASRMKEAYLKKQDDAEERHHARIQMIKSRARDETTKAAEIAFIMMLEKNQKKVTLDQRLQETRDRKLKIMEDIRNKQQ